MSSTLYHNGLILVLAIVLGSTVAQWRMADNEGAIRRYEEAWKQRNQNLCPFLQLGPDRVPLLSWACGVPMCINTGNNDRYVYDCCSGYGRSDIINNKCVFIERSWLSIVKFLSKKGYQEVAEALTYNCALPDLTADPSQLVYTVFVPKLDTDCNKGDINYSRDLNTARNMVHRGRAYSRDFKNGATIKNEYGVSMKITSYSTGLVFIECRMLVDVDQEAQNGIIHVTDGPLPATYKYPDLMTRLEVNADIMEFVRALPADLKDLLRQPKSSVWYTVFAPNNQAWSEAVKKLRSQKEIEDLARQHVVDKMICSRAVAQSSSKIGPTMANEYVKMSLRPNGESYIIDGCNNEINFVKRDMMSGNGVIHEIDRAITPIKVMDLNGVLGCLAGDRDSKVQQASRDMPNCGLGSDSSDKKKIILLPTDVAIASQSRDSMNRMRSDRTYRCNVYSYHVMYPKEGQPLEIDARGLNQERTLQTEYKTSANALTYVTNTYIRTREGSQLWFNDASAVDLIPIEYRDGIIYFVNRVNQFPSKTMYELVQEEGNTKKIVQKIDATGVAADWSGHSPKVVFLAPIDMGWNTRDKENGYTTGQTKKLLQLHTIPHAVFGGEDGFVRRQTIQEFPTLLSDGHGGQVKLIVKRHLDGTTFIGHNFIPEKLWAMVVKWNKVGTDGVVWIIDWPIECPNGLC